MELGILIDCLVHVYVNVSYNGREQWSRSSALHAKAYYREREERQLSKYIKNNILQKPDIRQTSFSPCIYLFLFLSMYLSISLSLYVSIYPSIHLYFFITLSLYFWTPFPISSFSLYSIYPVSACVSIYIYMFKISFISFFSMWRKVLLDSI